MDAECCPTCLRKRPVPRPTRIQDCLFCGDKFPQPGAGRGRKACDKPECKRKQTRYQKTGLAALDRMRDQ